MDLLFQKIDQLLAQKSRVICAIDGGAASGKTTLANQLQVKYGATIIHMDDFFLRPEQRTEARLNEIAGNIDYERFISEVLEPLSQGKDFSYQPYDCIIEELKPAIQFLEKSLTIIEGSYSLHPKFRAQFPELYDLKVFLKISQEEQRQRLILRNERLFPRFLKEWLPMENLYFQNYKIESISDLVLKN